MTARGFIIYIVAIACVPGVLCLVIWLLERWNTLYLRNPDGAMVLMIVFYLILSDLSFTTRTYYYGKEEW